MFDPNIPQPRDLLSNSQGDLLTNFQQLNTQFGVNHVPFDDASADKGKHKFVTIVEQSNDPETNVDEQIIYSKDDGGQPELFARPQNNGTPYRMTKDGAFFTGITPAVAVNFDGAGAIRGTALNVTSVTNPSVGRYVINFTNPLPDNNYYWHVSGFDNSGNPVISQVRNNGTYGTVVQTGLLDVTFKNQNNTLITGLVGAVVICWRVQ